MPKDASNPAVSDGTAPAAPTYAANAITSDKRYLWADSNQAAEERDATTNIVTKRYFEEGEQRIGGSDAGNYYYAKDHLGSVREVTDNTGTLRARYDYDLWGKRTKLSGNLDTEVGYTSHHHHTKSGLITTLYRFYDSETGRWLSRDPFGSVTSQMNAGMFQTAALNYYLMGVSQPEMLPFGSNLYGYVGGNPANSNDPEGEIAPWVAAAVIGAAVGGGLDLAEQLLSNGGDFGCVDWGNVGTSALAGAATSFLGPTGGLLGRGGKRAIKYGYNRSPGLLNRGNTRFGWSGPKNGRDVLSVRIGSRHLDIPGTGVKAGANSIRDGAVSGVIGGGAESNRNGTGGKCP